MVGTTIWATLAEGTTVCMLFFIAFSLPLSIVFLVLLWAGSAVAQRSSGRAESGGLLLLAGHLKPLSLFPMQLFD